MLAGLESEAESLALPVKRGTSTIRSADFRASAGMVVSENVTVYVGAQHCWLQVERMQDVPGCVYFNQIE